MKGKFLGCLLILTVCAAPAFGQCYRRSYGPVYTTQNYTPVVPYVKKEVVVKEVITPVEVPVAVPIVVPAFTYQYAPPVQFAAPPVQFAAPAVQGAPPCTQAFMQPPPAYAPAAAAPPQPGYAPAAPGQVGAQYAYPPPSGPGYASGGYAGASPSFSSPYASPYNPAPPQQPMPGYAPPGQPPQPGYPMAGGQQPVQATSVNCNFTQEQIKQLAAQVLAEMQRQSQGGPSSDSGPPPVSGTSPPVGAAPAAPSSGSPGSGPGGYPTVTPPQTQQPQGFPPTNAAPQSSRPSANSPLAVPAIAALSRNCAYCHTGGGARGDTVIFIQPGILNPDAPFRSMERELQAGRMPPRTSQFRPSPEEYGQIMAWLAGQ